jgi:toxin FitB
MLIDSNIIIYAAKPEHADLRRFISDAVLQQAIKLRQVRKVTLGDSLVAATALVHGRTLVARNAKHFEWIPGLTVLNPFAP